MTQRLTTSEAAQSLRKSPRWLLEWLRKHPADKTGEPYYTPAGRDKLFHQSDIARIELALREQIKCRSVSGRRVPVKRRTLKSEERTDDAAWRLAAELTGDATLSKNLIESGTSSTSTGNTQPRKLRVIQGSLPS